LTSQDGRTKGINIQSTTRTRIGYN